MLRSVNWKQIDDDIQAGERKIDAVRAFLNNAEYGLNEILAECETYADAMKPEDEAYAEVLDEARASVHAAYVCMFGSDDEEGVGTMYQPLDYQSLKMWQRYLRRQPCEVD